MNGYGNYHNRITNPIEAAKKAKLIFTDVETEGKKRGYIRAAKEYDGVYEKLKIMADETVSLKGMKREELDARADAVIDQLEQLEHQVDVLVEEVSRRYRIPPDDIRGSLGSGSLLFGGPASVDLLNMIYQYKKKKLIEAEQKGYKEAKELHEKAVAKLKKEIADAKTGVDKTLQELYSLICDVFDDIAKRKTDIAELNILLQGGQQ